MNHVWEQLRIWLDDRKKLQSQKYKTKQQNSEGGFLAVPTTHAEDQCMARSKSLPSIVALTM